MTPTLSGRWQTRLLLLATVGIFTTLPFAFAVTDTGLNPIFFGVLGYVALFGVGWDILYIYLQHFRWDRDWPGAFQLLCGIWEAIFLLLLVKTMGLPGVSRDLPVELFLVHYSCVWLSVYFASQTLMRILFPRWRFRGGQWW